METKSHFSVIEEDNGRISSVTDSCKATHRIILEGELVDFMFRDEPEFEGDSGWRFLSGTESQAYADNPDNWAICNLETLFARDKAIIPYMNHPIGTALGRVKVPDTFR